MNGCCDSRQTCRSCVAGRILCCRLHRYPRGQRLRGGLRIPPPLRRLRLPPAREGIAKMSFTDFPPKSDKFEIKNMSRIRCSPCCPRSTGRRLMENPLAWDVSGSQSGHKYGPGGGFDCGVSSTRSRPRVWSLRVAALRSLLSSTVGGPEESTVYQRGQGGGGVVAGRRAEN